MEEENVKIKVEEPTPGAATGEGYVKVKVEVEEGEKPKRNPGYTPPTPFSKNQIKKQLKIFQYEKRKKERRIREREKRKQKRQEAQILGLPLNSGPSRKALKKHQAKFNENKEWVARVAIDLDFDDLMSEQEIAKCIKQCLRIYTINRRSLHPASLSLTGLKHEGRIHKSLKRNDGWQHWKINYCFDKTHVEAFDTCKMIYLTAESDNVLETIEKDVLYVIGGLVDHNHQKGLCHERALRDGLATARLPLSEHVDMKTRKVLSTVHVFELLLHVAGGSDWTNAILSTVPLRKGAVPISEQNGSELLKEKDDESEDSDVKSVHEESEDAVVKREEEETNEAGVKQENEESEEAVIISDVEETNEAVVKKED